MDWKTLKKYTFYLVIGNKINIKQKTHLIVFPMNLKIKFTRPFFHITVKKCISNRFLCSQIFFYLVDMFKEHRDSDNLLQNFDHIMCSKYKHNIGKFMWKKRRRQKIMWSNLLVFSTSFAF